MGLNPGAIYWMDITFSTNIFVRIVMFAEKTKINAKEAEDGPFLKNGRKIFSVV